MVVSVTQDDDERVRHLPKDVSAEKGHAASLRSPINTVGRLAPRKTRQPPGVKDDSHQAKMAEFRPFSASLLSLDGRN